MAEVADAPEDIDVWHTWQSSTMAILERFRGIRRGLAAARALRGLRGGGEGVAPSGAQGPGAAPRAAAPRPADDPALRARLGRWRGRGASFPAPAAAAAMTAAERDAAMLQLAELRARLDGEQAALIDAALAGGAVSVRRLGPDDGHLWEMPGMRVFAIVGVQAFTVRDEDPPPRAGS